MVASPHFPRWSNGTLVFEREGRDMGRGVSCRQWLRGKALPTVELHPNPTKALEPKEGLCDLGDLRMYIRTLPRQAKWLF